MSNIQTVVIESVTIRQDANGRYCLNDLHRASGGEKRHIPSYWLSNQLTLEIISELEQTTGIPVVSTVEGRNGGTYVVKDLVYSYAMWISPRFHLAVVRVYDDLVTGKIQPRQTFTSPVMEWTTFIADGLRLEGSSRNYLFHKVISDHAPEMVKYLPSYSTDAPRDEAGNLLPITLETEDGEAVYLEGSSVPCFALTTLFKRFKIDTNARRVNPMLLAAGYLCREERPSRKTGVMKQFWSVTPKGLRYGGNAISRHNDRETQPVWYPATFTELMKNIGVV
jgi:hypothetical protein